MKIALCLYGNIRSFNNIWSTLYNKIVQPYSPDIFGFAWYNTPEIASNKFDRTHPIWSINNSNTVKKESWITKDHIESIENTIKPKMFISQDGSSEHSEFRVKLGEYKTRDHIKNWVMPLATYKNLWSQEQSVKLKTQYELHTNMQYDVVIMSRWDVIYENAIDIQQFDKNSITVPENFMSRRPNDFWLCGSSKNIDIVSSRFSAIANLMEPLPDQPSKFMENIMQEKNISYSITSLPINLLNRNY